MSGYSLHPQAKIDINDIYTYLLPRNRNAALSFLHHLTSAFRVIAQFPNSGSKRDFLASDKIRFKIVDHYWIAYAYINGRVTILLIFDGRREPRLLAALLRERFQS